MIGEKIKKTIAIVAFFIFLIIYFTLSLPQKNTKQQQEPPIILDNPQGVIFSKDIKFRRIENYEQWNPTKLDVFEAEKIITNCISNESISIFNKLSKYKRQYIGLIDKFGKHLVWINFFIDENNNNENWKKNIIIINDGGEDAFQATVDIGNKNCLEIKINGTS